MSDGAMAFLVMSIHLTVFGEHLTGCCTGLAPCFIYN